MGLITAMNSWMFNVTDFLLGKSAIFIVIFGWFLVITGLIFLLQPDKARGNLARKGAGAVKWVLTIVLIYLVLMGFSFAGKVGTNLAGSIALAAAVLLVWAYFYLIKRSHEFLTKKLALVPVLVLKVYAVLQLAVGLLMVTLHKRFW